MEPLVFTFITGIYVLVAFGVYNYFNSVNTKSAALNIAAIWGLLCIFYLEIYNRMQEPEIPNNWMSPVKVLGIGLGIFTLVGLFAIKVARVSVSKKQWIQTGIFVLISVALYTIIYFVEKINFPRIQPANRNELHSYLFIYLPNKLDKLIMVLFSIYPQY